MLLHFSRYSQKPNTANGPNVHKYPRVLFAQVIFLRLSPLPQRPESPSELVRTLSTETF